MKTILKYISIITFIILMNVLLSCNSIYDTSAELINDNNLSISFKISAPEDYALSKANNYEIGTNLESFIDFSAYDYRIYFFDKDNKYLTEWDQVKDIHVIKTSDYWIYTFIGKVPDELQTYNEDNPSFSVMVLANWPTYPDSYNYDKQDKTINDFINAEWAKFTIFNSFELSRENHILIPLYGLAKYTNITFTKDTVCDLGSINLLRAVAKVEINLTSLPIGVIVSNPVIRCINPDGYCAPQCNYGTGIDWDTDYVTDLHTPYGLNMNHENAINKSTEMYKVSTNKWIAYLPEFQNIGQENYSYIELKLNYKEEPFILNFAKYDEHGNPDNVNSRFNIKRNDLYKFNVTGDIHTIKFTIDVEEWSYGGYTEIDY